MGVITDISVLSSVLSILLIIMIFGYTFLELCPSVWPHYSYKILFGALGNLITHF